MKVSFLKLCCVVLLGIIATSALGGTTSRAEGTPAATQDAPGEKVKIKMADGLEIVGLFYATASKAPAVLLLHDGVNTKDEWIPYVPAFTGAGYNVLVVDQRGVGETAQSPTVGNAAELKDKDVPEMVTWLRQQPTVDAKAVALIGSRLGANYAIRACAGDEQCHTVIALTPSTNFFGIKTEDAIKAMKKDKAVFLAAAEYGENGGDSLKQLMADSSGDINFMVRVYGLGFEYGTGLFEKDPALMQMVLLWLKTYNHS